MSAVFPLSRHSYCTSSYSPCLPDASIAFIIYLLMLALTVNQMEWTSNPASISKLSRWTFAIQAIIDSYAFVTVGVKGHEKEVGVLTVS